MTQNKNIICISTASYIFLISLITILFYKYYLDKNQANLELAGKTVQSDSFSAENLSDTVFSKVTLNIRELGDTDSIKNFENENVAFAEDTLSYALVTEKYVPKLSIINTAGFEIIKLEKKNGDVVVTPKALLTNVSDDYHFKKSLEIEKSSSATYGTISEAISNNNSNTANFVIKVSTPIYKSNTVIGILVAEIDLFSLITDISLHTRAFEDIEVVFPTSDQLLISKQFKNSSNLQHIRNDGRLLEIWDKIVSGYHANNSNVLISEDTVIAFHPLTVPYADAMPEMLLLLIIPKNEITHTFRIYQLALPYILSVLPLTVLTIFIGLYIIGESKKSIQRSLSLVAIDSVSALVLTDKKNKIVKLNNRFLELSGYKSHEILGMHPSIFTSPKRFSSQDESKKFYQSLWKELLAKDVWEGELVNMYPNGEVFVYARIVVIRNTIGDIVNYAGSYIDVTKQKKMEKKLLNLSERDGLTDCWNRRKFDDEIKRFCELFKRYPQKSSTVLAIFDIDLFKSINDKYGHDKGDEVIKDVATVLNSLSRETDIVARIGGEEFALIMPNTQLEQAEAVLLRICQSITTNSDLNITVSVGVTEIDHHVNASFKRADQALYKAKELGRNRIALSKSKGIGSKIINV